MKSKIFVLSSHNGMSFPYVKEVKTVKVDYKGKYKKVKNKL